MNYQNITEAVVGNQERQNIARHISTLVGDFPRLRNKEGGTAVGFDLDKTIVYTNSSLMLPENSRESLRLVEFYLGKPLSYMTEATHAMLSTMAEYSTVLPVTARRKDQMDRIMLPWGTPKNYVCLAGAVVSHEGKEDHDWSNFVRESVRSNSVPLTEIKKILDPYEHEPWVLARRDFGDMFEVTTLDIPNVPNGFLQEVEGKVEGTGYFASIQGRKLYLTPTHLSKGDAFLYLTEKMGVTGNTYGAGDSLMDVDLLEKVDFAFHPLHGEMSENNAAPAHSIQSAQKGVLGGEEIVARIFASVVG